MQFFDLVKKRYSVRKYSSAKVPRTLIDQCLETARHAPSACNSQPWFFIVIDKPALLNKVTQAAFTGIYSLFTFAKDAPVLIVVLTHTSSAFARLGAHIKKTQYNLIDIGIVCDHFILQAAECGLGTCMIGWFNAAGVKKELSLPHNTTIDMLISVGYPEIQPTQNKDRKGLDVIRRYNDGP